MQISNIVRRVVMLIETLKYEKAFHFGFFMHIPCDEPISKAVKEAAAVLRELTYLCTKPYGWVTLMRCCSMWERTAMIWYFYVIMVSNCHQPVEFVCAIQNVPSVVCSSKGPALLVAFCIYQKIISIWQLLSKQVVNLMEVKGRGPLQSDNLTFSPS